MTLPNGLGGVAAKLARRDPDKIVLIDELGGQRSRAQLDARRRRIANALLVDHATGDRVAVLLPNSVVAAELIYGIATAGLVQVNVNDRLTAAEVRHILVDSGASTVIVDHGLLDVLDQTGVSVRRIVTGGVDDQLERAIAAATDSEPAIEVDVDAAAILIYTSGTTGRPKGVTLTHRNVLAGAHNYLMELMAPDAATYMACIPYFHVACVPNLAAIMRGMTVVVCSFEGTKVARLIEQHRVTHLPIPPTAIALLLDAVAATPHDLSSLRSILYAGSPMPEDLLRRAINELGPILEQGYGMTETAGLITLMRAAEHDLDLPERLASCGREITRVTVDVLDADGAPARPGAPGEIVVRGENVSVGYWNNAEATASAFADGAYRTGDLGVRDQHGFITIVGRIKDLIITGANNVYPVEVEKVIEGHPAIREVAVIGLPHDTWGETVTAVVVSEQTLTVDDLRTWCADRLAAYKQPRLLVQLDQLPRNAIGKVDKVALRTQAVSSAAGATS